MHSKLPLTATRAVLFANLDRGNSRERELQCFG